MSIPKMTKTQKLAMTISHTRDRIRNGNIDIQDLLYDSTMAYLNFCFEVIDSKVLTLEKRHELGLLDEKCTWNPKKYTAR